MAKQNFLAGGYYGKLGATVGQRWKNQRTIRTYVVPENPRTPKQMANRNKFSASVPFAQKGMSMNYRSPVFTSETTTEWALRMSSAKYAMDLGLSDVAAIPVVPRGFTSAYTITEITLESVIDATHARLSLVGTLPAGSKSYSLMIYFADGTRTGEYMLCEGVSDATDNTILTVTCEDAASLQSATIYGVIVSKDDIDAQTVTYSAKLEIKKESRPPFALQITKVTKTATTQGKLHITVETSFAGNNLVGTFSASNATLSGSGKSKVMVFINGGEQGAPTSDFEDIAATISDFTINKTTGVIDFDITPANVQSIHVYEGVFVTFQINWENAYTDETSMSSSYASSSSGWSGGYLQPEMDMTTANTFAVVLPTDSGYDETEISIESGYITEEIASAMQTLLDRTGIQMAFPLPTGTCNALQDGVTPISSAYTLSFDKAEVAQGDSGKFIFVGLAMSVGSFADVEEWTMVNITQTPTTAYLYTDAAHTVRAGLYNASKRWTPLPGANIPSVVNP